MELVTWTQTITPDPLAPVPEERMCLQYVRQTFGLPARYGSATEAWENATKPHTDRNYPAGVWFPVWWELSTNVNGHVALVAPDGTVYSTSNLAPHPLKHHPNIADVEAYYARYGSTLTYRGWSEDVAGFPVITEKENNRMATLDADDKLFIQQCVNKAIDQIWGTAAVTQKLIQGQGVDESELATALIAKGDIRIEARK